MATETIVKGPKHGNRAILVQEVDVVAGNVVPAPKSPVIIKMGEEHQFWLESNRALLVREHELGAGGTLQSATFTHAPQSHLHELGAARKSIGVNVKTDKKRK